MSTLRAQHHELAPTETSFSRRRFLVGGTMAGLSAGFLFEPQGIFAGQQPVNYGERLPVEVRSDPVFSLTRSKFSPHLGDQFWVTTDDAGEIALNLVEINDLSRSSVTQARGSDIARGGRSREKELSFKLVFIGPADQTLSQQTCVFGHPAIGDFKVLMVPVGSDIHGNYYEVVFNRSHL